MSTFTRRIREPVQRGGAEHYVFISLMAFAATIIATRAFLDLAGYPQIGGDTLHIAHVLWGGLLLFVAALLPLLFANRWVYTAGGLLSGMGMGLFIDEVGKFITQTNDYFYPPAAPIIYVVFLLTVQVYLRLRRPPSTNARAELYRALESLEEVLDHDLDPHERMELDQRLQRIAAQSPHADLGRLADALREFLRVDTLYTATPVARPWQRWSTRTQTWAARWLSQQRFKILLIIGLGAAGLPGSVALVVLMFDAITSVHLPAEIQSTLLALAQGTRAAEPTLPTVRLGLESVTGFPLAVAAGLLLSGRDRLGIQVGRVWLVVSLTIINVLVFYFDQFRAVFDTLLQFVLLLSVLQYQRRYLPPRASGIGV